MEWVNKDDAEALIATQIANGFEGPEYVLKSIEYCCIDKNKCYVVTWCGFPPEIVDYNTGNLIKQTIRIL